MLVDVFNSDTSSFFILLLAIVGITGEWRHRTIASSLLAAPDRLRFLAAKTLAFAAAGLGALVRSQVIAIAGVLLLSFVVEPTVLAFAPDVGRFGPLGALPVAASGIPSDQAFGFGGVDLVAPGLAILAMLAWIGVAFAAGAALLRARDLH